MCVCVGGGGGGGCIFFPCKVDTILEGDKNNFGVSSPESVSVHLPVKNILL